MNSKEILGNFPFGNEILALTQKDTSAKEVFILGVYASAVHARWIGPNGKTKINAVAVASEPEIFWRGSNIEASKIIENISLPNSAGRLIAANASLNGPSGKALDELFLSPFGKDRTNAWLCDLVPYSCMNEKQESALAREYIPFVKEMKLPPINWPRLPRELANEKRRHEILDELLQSGASIIITLGDLPLKWFTNHYGSKSSLSSYGKTDDKYGNQHELIIENRNFIHIPLVHPRQAAKLGAHSGEWSAIHENWIQRQ